MINRITDSFTVYGERKLGVPFPEAIPSQDVGSTLPYSLDHRNQVQWVVDVFKVTATDLVGGALRMLGRGK